VQKSEKEKVVAELTERLQNAQTLIVADYRGLSVTDIDNLRTKLLESGARFSVVKNTLTRRAAEAAGAESLLALLEGPTAIAFLEAEGDPVAVAKALADSARTTKVLAVRGGLLEGKEISAEDVAELAKLPPLDILRGQVLGAVTSPLTAIVGLFTAPLQNLVGLIDARIDQLRAGGDTSGVEMDAAAPAGAEAEVPPPAEAGVEASADAEINPPEALAEAAAEGHVDEKADAQDETAARGAEIDKEQPEGDE
jgi:large subunit ribosomal protein L10